MGWVLIILGVVQLTGDGRASGCVPASLATRIGALVRAIEESDEARIEEAVLRLSRSRRVFSPLAFAIGALALLFDGLRLLVSNWRLTLVQLLPAIWIWVAMADLKAARAARQLVRPSCAGRC